MKKRILFVCGGNTCRSPMAAAIASTVWRESVLADSAGVAAWEGKAASTAIQVIREDFGVDLSAHVPRDVEDLDLSGYDVIVALSGAIGDELRSRFAVDERRLVVWNVRDPYRGPIETYRRTAQQIRTLLRDLQEVLTGCANG